VAVTVMIFHSNVSLKGSIIISLLAVRSAPLARISFKSNKARSFASTMNAIRSSSLPIDFLPLPDVKATEFDRSVIDRFSPVLDSMFLAPGHLLSARLSAHVCCSLSTSLELR
jgi:hypothetical protein